MAPKCACDLVPATFWQKVKLWWRLEFGAYQRIRILLPSSEEELAARDASQAADTPWRQSVTRLMECAKKLAAEEPGTAWNCWTAAMRLNLCSLDAEAEAAERKARAVEILKEGAEKAGGWRPEAIKKILADEHGEVRQDLKYGHLYRAQRILDDHHQNLYRRLKVLRKRLRVLEIGGLVAIAGWLVLWPRLAALTPTAGQLYGPCTGFAIALMGFTGASVSAFSTTKGLSGTRVPLQEADFAIMLARFVFGTLMALVVNSLMAARVLDFGEPTVSRSLGVSFAAGFSERLVVDAVNSFAEKK